VKSIVVDTHTASWYLSAPRKLGREAKRILTRLGRGNLRAYIPVIVVVELALLQERGRRVVGPAEIDVWVSEVEGLEVLAMDATQAAEFALLPNVVDPFDRMIVAAARCTQSILISADERITDSNLVEVMWD
jgi:PIN domain nuclease of toxin-antitoxin system